MTKACSQCALPGKKAQNSFSKQHAVVIKSVGVLDVFLHAREIMFFKN